MLKKAGKARSRLWITPVLSIKKPAEAGFWPIALRKQKTINAWRTVDDDVLYAGRLSYVQPDEHHE